MQVSKNDFCHGKDSAVKVGEYVFDSDRSVMTGHVHFTEKAESHPGSCHGGSMCAVIDDAVGWFGFFVGDPECSPWSGYTAQINVSLKAPVPLGSRLTVRAQLESVSTSAKGKEKLWVSVRIQDERTCFCTGRGLFVRS